MEINKSQYTQEETEAAKRVLLELTRLLGEYKDQIVLIGGGVPSLLIANAEEEHIGTIDVDLALNHKTITEECYETICNLLEQRGYERANQPYQFFRTVHVNNHDIQVRVDFLAGEYQGTGKSHRTQKVQDLKARKARGCDLAFEQNELIQIEGELPDGGKDKAQIRVSGIVPFLIMKAFAMRDRLKEKDSWDLYYCIKYYPDGLDKLVQDIQPHSTNKLVQEGLSIIQDKFASPQHIGPKHVADFLETSEPDERDIIQTDAYERVKYIFDKLK